MMKEYEKKQKQILKLRQKGFEKIQKTLVKSKLDKHFFDISVVDPSRDALNTERGFFTSINVSYKKINVGRIIPIINEKGGLEYFTLSGFFKEVLIAIEYSRKERRLKKLDINVSDFKTVQECLDECKKRISIICDFFSKTDSI